MSQKYWSEEKRVKLMLYKLGLRARSSKLQARNFSRQKFTKLDSETTKIVSENSTDRALSKNLLFQHISNCIAGYLSPKPQRAINPYTYERNNLIRFLIYSDHNVQNVNKPFLSMRKAIKIAFKLLVICGLEENLKLPESIRKSYQNSLPTELPGHKKGVLMGANNGKLDYRTDSETVLKNRWHTTSDLFTKESHPKTPQ